MFGFIRLNRVGLVESSDKLVGNMTKPYPWTSIYWNKKNARDIKFVIIIIIIFLLFTKSWYNKWLLVITKVMFEVNPNES